MGHVFVGNEEPVRIYSYNSAVVEFARAKSKSAGRPLMTFGRLKLEPDGVTFAIYIHAEKVALLTPDNILTIVLPNEELCTKPHAYSAGMHKLLPVRLTNVGVQRYRVGHSRSAYSSVKGGNWNYYRKLAPEYFTGIQFHIESGYCYNSKPDRSKRINSSNRKKWVTMMQAWRTAMLIRAKTGVLDAVESRMSKEFLTLSLMDYPNDTCADLLFEAITNNRADADILNLVVIHSASILWSGGGAARNKTYRHWKLAIQTLINKHSLDFRARLGVFDGEDFT